MFLRFFFLFIILLLTLSSCKKEKTYWDVDLSVPVANASLSLSNLFPDTIISSNQNGNLSILFDDEVFSYTADSLVNIPDTTIYNSFQLIMFQGGYYPYGPGFSLDINSQDEVRFDFPNDIQLKEAKIRSGKLKILVKNPLRQPVIFKCYVLSAKKNNITLSLSIPINAGTKENPTIKDTLIDISGYKVSFSGAAGNKTNTIIQDLDFMVAPYASNDTIKYGDSLQSFISFQKLVPEFARGYFGNQTISIGPDSTTFDFFNQINRGTLSLDSAEIKLSLKNEFGVDIRGNIQRLTSIHPLNGTINLSASSINSPFNMSRATAIASSVSPVIPSYKLLSFTQSNSNITNFIGNLPNKIAYQLSAQINPLGNVSGFNDFVYFGTGLRADLSVKIPLRFSANNLVLKDTTSFNVNTLSEQLDLVNDGRLILKATNSYPFSLKLTGILLDENNQPIEQLIAGPNNLIDAPLLDINQIVTAEKTTVIYIPFDKAKLENMKKARKIAYYVEFNTANGSQSVSFYKNYKLDLLLTSEFNYTIKQ